MLPSYASQCLFVVGNRPPHSGAQPALQSTLGHRGRDRRHIPEQSKVTRGASYRLLTKRHAPYPRQKCGWAGAEEASETPVKGLLFHSS